MVTRYVALNYFGKDAWHWFDLKPKINETIGCRFIAVVE